jgi:hypothetical protein
MVLRRRRERWTGRIWNHQNDSTPDLSFPAFSEAAFK